MAYSSLIFCNLYFFRSLAIFFKCAIKLTWLIRPPFHSLEFSFCVFVEWIVQKIDIGIKKVFRIWLVLSFACYNPLHMWRFKACWRFCWDLLTRAIKTLNWAQHELSKDECISYGLHFFRERQKGLRRVSLSVVRGDTNWTQKTGRKEEKRMHAMTAYHNLLL